MAPRSPDLPRRTPNWDTLDFSTADIYHAGVGESAQSAITAGAGMMSSGRRVVVKLRAGTTYNESVSSVPHGVSGGWMCVTTDGTLPTFGTRMTPALAASHGLPIIVAADANNGIQHAEDTRGYRWQGLEVTASTTEATYPLIRTGLDNGFLYVRNLPQRLSFRQLYVHGHAAHQSRIRGFESNGSWLEIADCWLSQFNFGGVDYSHQSQSVAGYSGLGVQRIENNFMWGSLECIAYGGAIQYQNQFEAEQCLLSDVTIRRNHIYRPMSVKGDGSSSTDEGCANGIEFKIGRRVLIECNILENCWNNLQNGYTTATWSVNQGGGETYVQTCDLTIRNNWFKNHNSGTSISGVFGSPTPPYPTRINIHDNLFTGLGTVPWTEAPGTGITYGGVLLLNDQAVTDIWYHNNTAITSGGTFCLGQPAAFTRLAIEDNIAGYDASGFNLITGGGSGQTGWDLMNANGDCENRRNVYTGTSLVPNTSSQHAVLSSINSIGFVNVSSLMSNTTAYADLGNLALASSSPYKGVGPSGADPGCDITALTTALVGVETASSDLPP